MPMVIDGEEFDGPVKQANHLKDRPGVFAVVTVKAGQPLLVDIDCSDDLRRDIAKHPRRFDWQLISGAGGHAYLVRYDDDPQSKGRFETVRRIRRSIDIPCGRPGSGRPC